MLRLSLIAPATIQKVLQPLSKKSFEGNGGKIVAEEAYVAKDTDFNAILTNIKAKNPEFVFLPGFYEEVGLIIKQARALGIECSYHGRRWLGFSYAY